MSGAFPKCCYTARSVGYKYRTLATNTGDRKRDVKEDSVLDKNIRDFKYQMTSRINKEVEMMENSRLAILDKFEKVESKISSMLELQETVLGFRKNLQLAENALIDLAVKVNKIETANSSEAYSLKSKKSSFQAGSPIIEEVVSNVTHI